MEEGLLHSLRIAHKNSRVLEAAPIPLLQQVLNQRTALKENSCLSALLPLLGQKKPTEPLSFLLNIYREFVSTTSESAILYSFSRQPWGKTRPVT